MLHLHLRLKFCVLFSTYSRLEASVDILTGTWSYMYEVLYKAITWQIRDSHFFYEFWTFFAVGSLNLTSCLVQVKQTSTKQNMFIYIYYSYICLIAIHGRWIGGYGG